MKLGPVDGTVEEVRDLLENNGLKLEDYIEKPPARLKTRFLIAPSVILGIALLLLALFSSQCSPTLLTLIHLLGLAGGTWLTVSTQLRFKNAIATFTIAIGSLILILVASRIFSVMETAELIKDIR